MSITEKWNRMEGNKLRSVAMETSSALKNDDSHFFFKSFESSYTHK